MQGNTRVSTRVVEEIGIVDVQGEVTMFSEEPLQGAYEKLTDDGVKRIIFDFSGVDYINSAGMAVIIGILNQSRKRGQALRAWGLTEHFKKIFDMVGITKYMHLYDTEAEALKF